MILSIGSLSHGFGDNTLFNKISFSVEQGDKIGLIGANGAGKTTLFKIITGELLQDSGTVAKSKDIKVGYLEQHVCEAGTKTTLEEVLTVFKDLKLLESEIEKINGRLLQESNEQLIEKQHLLTEEYQKKGGLTYLSRAKSALLGLGFSEEKQSMSTEKLSGGQRSKIGLCKLLLSNSDLILLDEPTNHLDIDAIEWLEDYIKSYNGALIVISHDRYFLDSVTNRTFELENSSLYSFNGNYSRYSQVKREREQSEVKSYQNTMNEVRRIEKIIEQQKRWNREKNIKTAESKQKEIDRLTKDLIVPKKETKNIKFRFKTAIHSGNDVLLAENLKVEFSSGVLFENVNLDIKRNDRIFILGENGSGKTTLIKHLIKGGNDIKFGVGVKVGYFDQHEENLNLNNTIFEEIRNAYPKLSDTEIRSALARFLFTGDDVFKNLSFASGGERARVSLCKLMLKGANLLFLDEPTNHLDIYSREALEEALMQFDGTLVVVSHDRYFINKLSKKIMWLKKDGLQEVNGNWDTFYELKSKQIAAKKEKKEISDEGKRYFKEKERQSEIRKLRTKLRLTEAEISELENKIEQNNSLLQTEEVATDYEKTLELSELINILNTELEEKMELWESLSEKLK